MRILNISLWVLIIGNVFAAAIIFFAPEAFAIWLESVLMYFSPVENSILAKPLPPTLEGIIINGDVRGQAETVKR